MEKVYSYVRLGEDSSLYFDKAYYLVGQHFPHESVKFGYKGVIHGHKFFVKFNNITDEDRLAFALKTGIHLNIEYDEPKILVGLENDGRGSPSLEPKRWVEFGEITKYLHILPEESLFDEI